MKLQLSDRVYDVLKWTVLVALPAVSVLLVTLTQAWNWPIPIEAIVTTISGIEVFIGALIGISTVSYNSTTKEEE